MASKAEAVAKLTAEDAARVQVDLEVRLHAAESVLPSQLRAQASATGTEEALAELKRKLAAHRVSSSAEAARQATALEEAQRAASEDLETAAHHASESTTRQAIAEAEAAVVAEQAATVAA
eukprot:5757675-Prymnesium_polylepis.1